MGGKAVFTVNGTHIAIFIIFLFFIYFLFSCVHDGESCLACYGSGTCRICNGKGIVGVQGICSECNGSGKCYSCQGTGKIRSFNLNIF